MNRFVGVVNHNISDAAYGPSDRFASVSVTFSCGGTAKCWSGTSYHREQAGYGTTQPFTYLSM